MTHISNHACLPSTPASVQNPLRHRCHLHSSHVDGYVPGMTDKKKKDESLPDRGADQHDDPDLKPVDTNAGPDAQTGGIADQDDDKDN